MNNRNISLIVLIILVSFIFMGAASAANTDKNVNLNDKRFSTVNLPFVENNGQITDKSVKYSANTFIGNVYVKNNGIVYSLTKDKKGWIVTESFLNANSVNVKGQNPTKTKVNYYKGNNVQKNVATYNRVKYSNLYTGVNLYLKAHGKNIEKIYAISSTGTPSSIWVTVKGAKGLKINQKGELVILNGSSALKLTKPVAYQIINGKKVNVSVSYLIKNSSYGYKTGSYNKNYKLIIDPLLNSTYLGGNSYDNAQGVAVDQSGNVYVAGYTGSNDFPTDRGQNFNVDQSTGEWDVFVSKLDNKLENLIACTYIGGSDSDQAYGIALDNNGKTGCHVFITGITYSNESTPYKFPTTNGAYNETYSGGGDAFVCKFNNDLTLNASTYLGGCELDRANAIIVDASNNVYVTGQTFSYLGLQNTGQTETYTIGKTPSRFCSIPFPVTQTAYQETYNGAGDVFVSKFNNALSNLTASTFIGGSGEDIGYALATDQQNYIYVTGSTNSSDFPVKNYPCTKLITGETFINGYKGEYDAFVVKLAKQHLEKLEASSLLGGSERDEGRGIAIDPLGRVYIVGGTWSGMILCDGTRSSPMQTTNGAKQTTNKGMEDAFVIIFDKQIQTVLSSTYLGGNGIDIANGIVLSDQGNIGIIGTTNSTNFEGFAFEDIAGISSQTWENVFFTKFINIMSGDEEIETTILGGSNADYGQAIAIDKSGNVYLTGKTWSNDFPTTIGAYATYTNDNLQYTDDVFISKIDNLVDTEAPQVRSTDPPKDVLNVPVNKVIKIVFDETIQEYSLNSLSNITLKYGNLVAYISSIKIVGNTLIISPQENYFEGTKYTLSIPNNTIKDLANNTFRAYAFNFTTVGLNVLSTDPMNNKVTTDANKLIKITFNKAIKFGTNQNIVLMRGINQISINKQIDGNVLTISGGPYTDGTYTLTIPFDSILDNLFDKPMLTDYTTSFTVDSTSPTVTNTDPNNNQMGIPVDKVIKINFSEAIKFGTNPWIELRNTGTGAAVPFTPSISGNTLIITPNSALAKGNKYTIILHSGCIKDLSGNNVNLYYTAFTTTTATTTTYNTAANTPPTVISSNPVNNAVNIPTNKVIKINFSEAIKFGTNVWIELKSSSGKAIPFTKTISGSTLSITPTTTLAKGTTYTVIIHTNSITDLTGKGLATVYTTKFKTAI